MFYISIKPRWPADKRFYSNTRIYIVPSLLKYSDIVPVCYNTSIRFQYGACQWYLSSSVVVTWGQFFHWKFGMCRSVNGQFIVGRWSVENLSMLQTMFGKFYPKFCVKFVGLQSFGEGTEWKFAMITGATQPTLPLAHMNSTPFFLFAGSVILKNRPHCKKINIHDFEHFKI